MKVSKLGVQQVVANWPKKDKDILFMRFEGKKEVDILNVYKLFEPEHLYTLLDIMCRNDLVSRTRKNFKNTFKEPSDLSKLREAYIMVWEKSFKQALKGEA